MTGDGGGLERAQGALAARRAQRRGDFGPIYDRLRAGIPLSAEEYALLDQHERGAKLKTGQRDPKTNYETVVCWRWLTELNGWTKTDAFGLLSDMTGTTADAVKGRINRAKGLGRNFADLCFDIHVERGTVPALLRNRDENGRCTGCGKVNCKCNPAPRPAFKDTAEGTIPDSLLAFWRSGG